LLNCEIPINQTPIGRIAFLLNSFSGIDIPIAVLPGLAAADLRVGTRFYFFDLTAKIIYNSRDIFGFYFIKFR